jgi:hypothetical protein
MTFIEPFFNIKNQLFRNEVSKISSGPIMWNNKWETVGNDFAVSKLKPKSISKNLQHQMMISKPTDCGSLLVVPLQFILFIGTIR